MAATARNVSTLRELAALPNVMTAPLDVTDEASVKTDFLTRSLDLVSHPAYERAFDNYMGWVRAENRKAVPPDGVAATILKMCGDRSARLRYPVGERVMLALHRLLPDAIWRGLMAEG